MKYGAELMGRSVPEWRAQNILYDELKEQIKRATSAERSAEADKELEHQFAVEFDTVCQFVSLKRSELDYRLSNCKRIAAEIGRDSKHGHAAESHDSQQLRILHRELAGLSRDTQLLSRFVGAQHTGFRKLIKKYRKWSRDKRVLSSFESQLNGPNSFAALDFDERLDELSSLYGLLRNSSREQNNDSNTQVSEVSEHWSEALAERLHFDASLSSSTGTVQKYWVHSDRTVELKLRLLQNLTLIAAARGASDRTYVTALHSNLHAGSLEKIEIREKSLKVVATGTALMLKNKFIKLNPTLEQKLYEGTLATKDLEPANPDQDLLEFATGDLEFGVRACSTRDRFKSADRAHMRAILDQNITVDSGLPSKVFPYAVLETWSRTSTKPNWISELENARVIFPVSTSFSIESFASFMTIDQADIPGWLKSLEEKVDVLFRSKEEETKSNSQSQTKDMHLAPASITQQAPDLIADSGDTSPSPDRARYWNEFDHPEDEQDDNAFAVFIDDEYEAMRRIQQQRQLSQPVLVLGKQVRAGLTRVRSFLGIENTSFLPPTWSSNELGSCMSDTTETQSLLTRTSSYDSSLRPSPSLGVGDYSPRLTAQYGTIDDDLGQATHHSAEHQSGRAVLLISLLALYTSCVIAAMATALILGDGPSNLPRGVKAVSAGGYVFSLALSGLGTYCFYLRDYNSWQSEVAVNALQLALVCVGVGGVVFVSTS